MDEQFDADEILREPDDYIDMEEQDERQELILGQNRIINLEEVPIDDDDLYSIYE